MSRSIVFPFGAVLLALSSPGCTKPADEWGDRPGPKAMAMFAPLCCFAANVAGDDATVHSLLTSQGWHDYVGTARDGLKLSRADLLFIVGLDADDTPGELLQKNCGNANLTLVKLGNAPCLTSKLREMQHSPAHAGHGHGKYDPHIWLGIPEAICMVETIRDAFKSKDPAHAAGYDARAAAYITRLKKLQDEGLALLADKKDRNLISSHESLKYFAASFNLNVVASVESKPGTGVASNTLNELIRLCKEKNVRLITVEPQYPANNAGKTLLEALKRQGIPNPAFVEIDPIENVAPGDLTPTYYEDKMRDNLKHLAASMQ